MSDVCMTYRCRAWCAYAITLLTLEYELTCMICIFCILRYFASYKTLVSGMDPYGINELISVANSNPDSRLPTQWTHSQPHDARVTTTQLNFKV